MKTAILLFSITALSVGSFFVGKEVQRQNFVDIVYDCVLDYQTNAQSMFCVIRSVE